MHLAGLPGQGQGSDNIKLYGIWRGEECLSLLGLEITSQTKHLGFSNWENCHRNPGVAKTTSM